MSMNEEEEGGEKAEKKATENLHAFSSREHYGKCHWPISELRKLACREITVLKLALAGKGRSY